MRSRLRVKSAGATAHARGSDCGLAAGVTGADDSDLKLFAETHVDIVGCWFWVGLSRVGIEAIYSKRGRRSISSAGTGSISPTRFDPMHEDRPR